MKTTKKNQGEFYVDYDDESGLWCVFHTEDTRAYSSWPTEAQARASLPQSKGLK